MFLLDPATGRRRRALVRDKTARVARRTSRGAAALAKDVQNRAAGVAARLNHLREGAVDDTILEERVRAALGRVCSHPGAIAVSIENGTAILRGPVLAHEHADVLAAAGNVRGITAVEDQLAQHEEAGSIPGLQGEGRLPKESRNGLGAAQWLTLAAGAALFIYGLQRRALA